MRPRAVVCARRCHLSSVIVRVRGLSGGPHGAQTEV